MSYFQHRMSRRAYHSVIKRKSQALFIGDMGIDYFRIEGIALTKSGKKHSCVSFQVSAATYRQQKLIFKQFCLLVIAEYCTFSSFLLFFQKLDDIFIITVKKYELRRGSVMLVLHSGRKWMLVFT